jgi:hypothetical protein
MSEQPILPVRALEAGSGANRDERPREEQVI